MKSIVVDASSIVRVFETGKEHESARRLLKKIQDGSIDAHAPTFLLVEVINILLKKKKFSKVDATEFVHMLEQSGIIFTDFASDRIYDLLECSYTYKITPYDAQYVLLSSDLSCVLLTQDKELLAIKGIGVSLDEYSVGS